MNQAMEVILIGRELDKQQVEIAKAIAGSK